MVISALPQVASFFSLHNKGGFEMNICTHAIRRYKKRLGSKSASKARIVSKIQKELQTGKRYFNRKNNHLYIETPRFTAVCYKNTVITILLPEEVYKGYEKNEQLPMQQRNA